MSLLYWGGGGDSVIVIGADANCQLNPRDTCVGPLAAGERLNEHERAELLYGFLAQRVLRAVTTYNRGGHTRFGLGIRGEKEAPSQIDFVFCSSGLLRHSRRLGLRVPLKRITSRSVNRFVMFRSMLPKGGFCTNDRSRHPGRRTCYRCSGNRDLEKFQSLVTSSHARTVPEEMERIRVLAAGEQRAKPTDHGDYLQTLWRGLRRHRDTVTRRAYHHLIRDEQRKRKRQRESDQLDRLLSGQSGGFGTLARRPARLNIPTTLEGDRDRKRWGRHIGDFYRRLYESPGKDDAEKTHRLWVIIRKLAAQERKERAPIAVSWGRG